MIASHGEDPAAQAKPNTQPKIPFGNRMADQSEESDTMLAVLAEEDSGDDRRDDEKFTEKWGQDEPTEEQSRFGSLCYDEATGYALSGAQSDGNLLSQSGIPRMSDGSNGPHQVTGLRRPVEDL